jgi:hypothetical protein
MMASPKRTGLVGFTMQKNNSRKAEIMENNENEMNI